MGNVDWGVERAMSARAKGAQERKIAGITRGDFLTAMVIVGAALSCAGIGDHSRKGAAAMDESRWSDRDRFGGWTGKQFEATGFFRTEHDGERWWLVTPEGHPFISFGLNHFHAAFWNYPYNSEHWMEQFGAQKPMDEAWKRGFRDNALKLCQGLGINALGIHNDAVHLANEPQGAILPYIRRYEPVVLSHYRFPKAENYHDVFAPEFVTHCDEVAGKQVAPYKDDPMLIGFSMSDAPLLTDYAVKHRPPGATTWPRVLRNLDAHAPGKRAYVEMVRERHTEIAAFNAAYGTDFGSWDALAAAENWRLETDYSNRAELEDNAAFLRLCIDKCYTVSKAALRRYDPNHMFLGNKLGTGGDNFAAAIEVAAPHVDLINYGNYGRLATQERILDRWTDKVNKPFLNADGSFSLRSEMVPNPLSPPESITDDAAQYVAWTRELAAGLFARPDVVGWNMCGVMECWKTAPGREKRQHQGIMDPFGKIHPGMEAAIRDVSSRLYQIASSQDAAAGVIAATLQPKEQDPNVIGRKGYVHLERIDGIWWLVDGNGNRFVPTGMNHIGEMYRFAPYNREFWLKEFGEGIYKDGRIDWDGPEVKEWMARVAKDHRDFGFNTIAFHRSQFLPDECWEDLEIFYFGKPKLGEITAKYAARWWGGMPDVFSEEWQAEAEETVKEYCEKHKNNRYCLGHAFNDQPDYSINAIRKNQKGFFHHPWVIDIIKKPGLTPGKKVWLEILQRHYSTPGEAGDMYGVPLETWEDVGSVTEWPKPKDQMQGEADQTEMLKMCVEAWLKTHHDLLKKHDPNHLIYGDKIGMGVMGPGWGGGQPEWIWEIVKKYVDVVFIQSYDFFNQRHLDQLTMVHEKTGLPIINGDHSYGFKRPKMNAVKGVPVSSLEDVGIEYSKYLKGIMGLPYMLGWQTCGYMETWSGVTDPTGQEQGGFFDPYGEPLMEALVHAKAANEQAVEWHQRAGYPKQEQAQETGPSTVSELFAALKLTEEQQAAFQVLEEERKAAFAGFESLEGEELSEARRAFFTHREAKIRELFTEEQMALWTPFWARPRSAKP